MMNRRGFIGGAALVAMARLPEPQVLYPPLTDPKVSHRISLVIDGWSASAKDDDTDQVSIRINSGWRTAWR
jgi:hypothetical protein